MKNNDFLNICYKYFNRLIDSKKLIELLKSINNNEDISNIINNIENIISNPSYTDDFLISNEKDNIENIINILDNIPDTIECNNIIDKFKEKIKNNNDSYDVWFNIIDYLSSNEYFNKCFDSLNDYELLCFITQYIKVLLPPQIDQNKFNQLVIAGIDKNENEWLWRLALNYYDKNIDISEIIDYFIDKKDANYLVDFISFVGNEDIIDNVINKINNKELIDSLITNNIKDYITDKQYQLLINNKCK